MTSAFCPIVKLNWVLLWNLILSERGVKSPNSFHWGRYEIFCWWQLLFLNGWNVITMKMTLHLKDIFWTLFFSLKYSVRQWSRNAMVYETPYKFSQVYVILASDSTDRILWSWCQSPMPVSVYILFSPLSPGITRLCCQVSGLTKIIAYQVTVQWHLNRSGVYNCYEYQQIRCSLSVHTFVLFQLFWAC